LTRHEGLAKEYAGILLSYARQDGNYLEHEVLQQGLLWGIGRLSQVRPDLVKDAVPYLISYLKSDDATVRGLATWVTGLLGLEEARPELEHLTKDEAEIQLYSAHKLLSKQVRELAQEALEKLPKS